MPKSIRTLVLILALFAAGQAQDLPLGESLNLRYSGEIGGKSWYFYNNPSNSQLPDFVNSLRGRLDMTLQFNAPLELRSNLRFQYDPDNDDRNRYLIEDLYFDYFSNAFEIRAGYQIFSWKTVESASIADFLNQTDLESDLLDAEKLSELAVRLRLIPPTDIEQVFEIYYIARLQPALLPRPGNWYSFGFNVSNDSDNHLYQGKGEQWRPQIAVSYQRPFFDNVDTRLFYFNGYNRFPGIVAFQTDDQQISTVQVYPTIQKAGLTFQGEIGAWLVKGELVYTDYLEQVRNQFSAPINPRYLAWVSGFEYTFYSPFLSGHDIGTILEILGDSDTGKDPRTIESFRPFQNHLFGGLRYTFNNIGDRSLLLGGFYNYRESDLIISFEYEERIREVFTVKLAYNGLFTDSAPLNRFDQADRLILDIGFNF